ncbi:metallophosphoesterase family protein [Microbacterium sp. P06]|uniref:metallophosphoesterase family protein n=1 Tax=unclassified Microbacterium TaxID=2609290 RepID=UPI003745A8E7
MRPLKYRRTTIAATGVLLCAALATPLLPATAADPAADSAEARMGQTDPVGTLPLLSDPFLQIPSADSVNVVWNTEYAGTANVVLVGEGVARLTAEKARDAAKGAVFPDVRVVSADSKKFSRMVEDYQSRLPADRLPAISDGIVERDVWRHEAVVDGLKAGESAPYRVVSIDGEGFVASGTFSLAPLPAAGDDLRILLTSDHQAMANTPANLQKAAETIGEIDAVFLAGDLANQPDRASEWFDDTRGSAFLSTLQGNGGRLSTGGQEFVGGEIIQNAPLYPAIGNHEVQGRMDGAATIGGGYGMPVPVDVAEAEYEKVAAEVNPTGDAEIKARWMDDNSFSTTTYEEMFTLPEDSPGGETYYATTFGDVRLITLYSTRAWRGVTANPVPADRVTSSRYQETAASLSDPLAQGYGEHVFESLEEGSEQYEWLQDELASSEFEDARFRVVMLHEGPQGLGDNIMPHFSDPERIEEKDAEGNVIGVRYEYKPEDNMLLKDLTPLLEEAGVDLVQNGHSHLWNRFKSENGVNYLETSNTGNTYGAFHELSGKTRPLPPEPWNASNYMSIGNPGGLEPIVPNVKPFTTADGVPEPYVQSNDLAVFAMLDTAENKVVSYAYDVKTPGVEPWIIDEFSLGREAAEPEEPEEENPGEEEPEEENPEEENPGENPGDDEPVLAPRVTLTASSVTAGGTLSVDASGFAAESDARVELRSTPVTLAMAETTATGTLRATVTIPASTPAGAHRIVVTDADGNTAAATLTVTADGSLAVTGSEPVALWIVAAAAGLIVVGAVAFIAVRLRRRRA